jgi:hypothetical protein
MAEIFINPIIIACLVCGSLILKYGGTMRKFPSRMTLCCELGFPPMKEKIDGP